MQKNILPHLLEIVACKETLLLQKSHQQCKDTGGEIRFTLFQVEK